MTSKRIDLDNFLFDLEVEKRKKIGGSCILTGRSFSGKTSLVNAVLNKHSFRSSIEIFQLNGHLYADSFLATDYKPHLPSIFIVDNFELFATKQKTLLYGLLNNSQNYPWFVLLVGKTQNSINLLEKRLLSRTSKIHIDLLKLISFKKYCDCFKEMLGYFSDVPIVKSIIGHSLFESFMMKCYNNPARNNYCFVKRLVALLMSIQKIMERKIEDPVELIEFCANSLDSTDMDYILERLSLRQICIMLCVLRSSENVLNYHKALIEYKSFVHQFDNNMDVEDSTIFNDLNELMSMRLIVAVKGTEYGQLKYRKIHPNIDEQILIRFLNSQKIPITTKIRYFIFGGK